MDFRADDKSGLNSTLTAGRAEVDSLIVPAGRQMLQACGRTFCHLPKKNDKVMEKTIFSRLPIGHIHMVPSFITHEMILLAMHKLVVIFFFPLGRSRIWVIISNSQILK